jgi:hypothetical protein
MEVGLKFVGPLLPHTLGKTTSKISKVRGTLQSPARRVLDATSRLFHPTERIFGLAPGLARCKLGKIPGRIGAARRARMLCGIFSVVGRVMSKGQIRTMRSLLILVAICYSATAFAQSAPPKLGSKPLVQVRPKEPMGCKLIGTVRGTKLWAGDCVGSELRGSTPATEHALPEQPTGAITSDQKE